MKPSHEDRKRSAILVPAPEAGNVVEHWRERYDAAAERGIPAHVTINFPFLLPANISAAEERHLADYFASVDAFAYRLERTARFADKVLYLRVAPREPFDRLIADVADLYPTCPPYGGKYEDVIPHLTVADGGSDSLMDAVATEVDPHLPIDAVAREAWLMVGGDRGWALRAKFPFRGA